MDTKSVKSLFSEINDIRRRRHYGNVVAPTCNLDCSSPHIRVNNFSDGLFGQKSVPTMHLAAVEHGQGGGRAAGPRRPIQDRRP